MLQADTSNKDFSTTPTIKENDMNPMHRYLYTALSLLVVSFLSACSSTTLTESWSEPNFTEKPPQKILIVGVMRNDLHRNMYEDQFVAQLQRNGVQGIASYTVMDDREDYYDEATIQTAVQKTTADAVLIARLAKITKEDRYIPPNYSYSHGYSPSFGHRRGFYDYYGMSYRVMHTPGYTTVDTTVKLETTLFLTSTQQMVWAGATKSFNPSSAQSVIKKNAELIVADMKKSGLIQ